MEKFAATIDQLLADNVQVKECVVRFDNTICKKANKSELTVIRLELEKTFINKSLWTSINSELAAFTVKFDKETDRLDGKFMDFEVA